MSAQEKIDQIKKLREMTGAGILDVKAAFEEAGGDEGKTLELLHKRGADRAAKKSERVTSEGIIAVYRHANHKIGAMVKLTCETDFVARNEEFREFGKDLAMHVSAFAPLALRPEEISGVAAGQAEELALLTQAFLKDPSKSVSEVLTEKIHKIGENIQIGGFVRYEV
jgi:elongation factor Ts